MFELKEATRQRRPLKVSLEGVSGSGKTCTALRLAFAMRRAGIGKRIAVGDSENGRAESYAGAEFDGEVWKFQHCRIPKPQQNPVGYTALYKFLIEQGFDIIIIDSMSHAWHGVLDQVDQLSQQSGGKDKFGAWAKVTPPQREMIQTLTDERAHLIATMRVKSEYAEEVGPTGKKKFVKLGLKADQRDHTEYEFDVVIRMIDVEHNAVVEKASGCQEMDGRTAVKPGPEFWRPLFDWWLMAPDAIEDARRQIAEVTTESQLVEVYRRLNKTTQDAVVEDCKRRKAELAISSSPPPPPPPVEPEPPPAASGSPAPESGSPASAVLDLVRDLDELVGAAAVDDLLKVEHDLHRDSIPGLTARRLPRLEKALREWKAREEKPSDGNLPGMNGAAAPADTAALKK